jgi:phosphoribosylformylglycinamidine synthase
MVYVLKKLLKREVVTLWHKDTCLQDCDMVILPGGFSFGDYLRSGAIARFSPIMEQVIGFANKGGLVLGICNGFQILCEAQLLPGALLHNNNHRFICRNTYIRTETQKTIFTSGLNVGQVLKIPIAHGEGRYFAPDDVLNNLNKNDQILFRYCNESGLPTEDVNPNGSIQNIAGVCNEKRNVFGMMPHPERAADPELGNTDGRILFDSVVGMLAMSGV